MARLYSNPWKPRVGFKSKVKYFIRNGFYKWLLKKYCKDCRTVLDVACGPGQFSNLLSIYIPFYKAVVMVSKRVYWNKTSYYDKELPLGIVLLFNSTLKSL